MTGQNTARPPHSEQNGALAVVDDIRFRRGVGSPLPATNGAALHPPCTRGGPNFFHPAPERGLPVAAGTARVLSGGPGVSAHRSLGRERGTAAFFQFGLTARQLGGNRGGQGSKRRPGIGLLPHANQHEVRNVRFVGKAFQSNGEVHERGY